ncbi:sulfite exporter TauE/SafE family protein [Pelagibacterium lacus]|uniref:sulfite exporter TauE/SafE family protein n=1 Tax=Pelagibacterium lacus TaxID=2282655 RepID=UPI00131493E4|nr:sulfite exporter TauE/SafE family protein [Pelagibacterium lacus]
MEPYLVIVLGGAALAGFVQGLSGFAFALVSLSVWAWAVSPELAAPMAVFGSLVGQLVTIPVVGANFRLKGLAPFIVGGVLGVPMGIFLLSLLDPTGFKLALGLFLLAYSPAMLFVSPSFRVTFGGNWANGAVGWLGGVFGGMGGLAGAIPTLWCTLTGMNKESQRGIMQGFNITMHVTTLIGYFLAGTISSPLVWQHFGLVAAALVAPALLGGYFFNRLDTRAFRRLVLLLLFVSGLVLTSATLPQVLAASALPN